MRALLFYFIRVPKFKGNAISSTAESICIYETFEKHLAEFTRQLDLPYSSAARTFV